MRADVRLLEQLATQSACLVTVQATRGSVPREAGTWMAVLAGDVLGTIGGGQLEFQAIEQARQLLKSFEQGHEDDAVLTVPPVSPLPLMRRFALGPNLGQCCGGEMHLEFECVTGADTGRLMDRLKPTPPPVALFGGGHVGKALVHVLGALPLAVSWFDSRDEIFPAHVPDNVVCEHSDPVQGAVATLLPGSMVLIMSFSHAQDLDVVAACLQRQRSARDLALIGLIGSQTKWATFRHRLAARGFEAGDLARVTCPIGIEGITSKEPAVIAVSVAAQILRLIEKTGVQQATRGAQA